MADRKKYVVEIDGLSHFMLLDADDAQRYGDRATEVKAVAPKNKSRKPANKAVDARKEKA